MATITASVGGGNWNTNGAWVGSVQPTAADDVLLTATSGNITIPSGVTALCRSLDCTGYTGVLTFSATTSELDVGDGSGGACKFVSGMTVTLTAIGKIKFVATTASTTYALTTGGKVMPNLEVATGSTTTIQFADAMTATGATLTHTSGKWDFNGQTVSALSFTSSNSTTRTWTPGGSAITLTNPGVAVTANTVTNLTVTANTATVTFNNSNAQWQSGTFNWNGLSVSFTANGTAVLAATSSTFNNVTRSGTAVKTDAFSVGGAPTITGTLTLNSNSVTNRLLVQSNTVGTARTITAATVTCTNVIDFQDITGAGAATWTTGASGATYFGDCGGNSGITFTTSSTQTATGTASFTWSTHGWTTRVPLPQDDVVINNAFVAGRTITADMPRLGRSIDFTGCTGNPTVSFSIASIFGSLTLVSGITSSGNVAVTFRGRSSYTLTTAGVSIPQSVTVNAPSGTLTLQDALTTTASITFTSGTFADNGQSVSLGNGTAVQVFGGTLTSSGAWTYTGTNTATVWTVTSGTITHTGSFAITAASANTRTFDGGGKTYGTLTYTVAGSTGQLTLIGSNTFTTINFSDASNARTLALTSGTTTTVTNMNVNGLSGLLMSLNAVTSGSAATLATAAGASMVYVSAKDITATPSKAVYVLDGTNVSGNTGIVFEPQDMSHPELRIPAMAGSVAAVQRAGSW